MYKKGYGKNVVGEKMGQLLTFEDSSPPLVKNCANIAEVLSRNSSGLVKCWNPVDGLGALASSY